MRFRLLIAAACVAALPLAPAHAQTLQQKHTIAAQQQKLDMYVTGPQAVNDACHLSLTTQVDWQSFIDASALDHGVPGTEGPASLCARPLDAIAQMCGSNAGANADANKAAMTKIKSYRCVYTPGQPQNLSLDPAGMLTYKGDYTTTHAEPFTTQWLGQHL